MNENLLLYVNQSLLNLAIQPYFNANQASFGGNTTVLGTAVAYAAGAAPTFVLTAAASNNVTATFDPVTITLSGQPGAAVTVTVTGTLAVANGVLSITALSAGVSGGGNWLDNKIAAQVNTIIGDQYAGELAKYPIPVFGNLLGTGISVQLQNASVSNGAASVSASVTYQGQGPAGPAPISIPVPATPAVAALSMNQQAVQTALESEGGQFPLNQPVNSISEHSVGILGHFGYGVQGNVEVSFPNISLSGSNALASVVLGFNLQGGIEAFGAWTWVGLPIPPCGVQVALQLLQTNAQTAAVMVVAVISINWPSIDFPSVLSGVGDDIMGLIEGAVGGQVTAALAGKTFTLFTLPSTIPGTSVPVVLSFNALGFASSAVLAVVEAALG